MHHGFRTEEKERNIPSEFGNIPRGIAYECYAIAPMHGAILQRPTERVCKETK